MGLTLDECFSLIQDYDTDLASHCLRVSQFCTAIATTTRYALISSITRAAYVHDIGKILVPIQILNKPAKLDTFEKLIMGTHAQWGYEILTQSELTEIERLLVLYHHGTFNYPINPIPVLNHASITPGMDNNIIEGSMILQACDIFDAIVSKRSYKDNDTIEDAITALYQKHIPVSIIQAFRTLMNTNTFHDINCVTV